MLLFADTESIIQPPPLCDPRSELQARKKEYLQQLWMKPNMLPTGAAWKLQTTWNIQQTFLPDRNMAVDASDNK